MTIVKTVNPKISKKTNSAGTNATKPTHRRRPKEETENLILQEAELLLIERLASASDDLNPLASLRITDVLASINSKLNDDQLPMTTGSAYQIWKSDFGTNYERSCDTLGIRPSIPSRRRAKSRITS
jgi:hypothetical protein